MFVKFVKDDKTIEEVSISSEMIPFPTDIVVLEAGKFTVESREYDILDGEIGRRPRFKLWCPEMDVWVRIPLKLLIIKGRRIYERTIRRIKETV